MSKNFKGIGASNGIAFAKAYILKKPDFSIDDTPIDDVQKELTKYQEVIDKTVSQLERIKEIATNKLGADKASVFDAHIQIANDPEIQNEIKNSIEKIKINLPFAIDTVYDKYYEMFKSMEDKYFKERAADVADVKKRMLSNALNQPLPDLMSINSEVIVVANDLTPSETALLDKKYVKGFVTEVGGRTSHAAIMARTLEIPAVLGIANFLSAINDKSLIALNGSTGEVELDPSDLKKWEAKRDLFLKEKEELKKYIHVPTKTKDGHSVHIESNIGKPDDANTAINNGCEGIGLYRSEFLYMDNDHWPTEDEQYEGYKSVLEQLKDKLIVIRTLDIGGDKKLSYYQFPEEMNPFLGYRAIRFCLDNKEIFKTQLRALGRASVHGRLAIMFPMIATIDEFVAAKNLALECFKELKNEGHKVSDSIQIGMMVEIPSSAILADQFAKHADFFSIGTNDLNQYSFACDRMSQKVSYLYQPNNPALLRLINETIKGGHSNKRWVGMCGEMAGDILSIPILLGLGLDAFSMSATSMPKARMIINNLNFNECKEIANKAIQLQTIDEVNKLVNDFLTSKNLI